MQTSTNVEVSRRRFMKTALAGGVTALAGSSLWQTAAAMVSSDKGRQVHGVGIEDPELVQLSINENPLGASPYAIQAVAQKLGAFNRYPPREPVLQEAIARYHGDGITHEMVANGVGSTEILKAVTLTALLNGGGAVTPVPSYRTIMRTAENIGRPSVTVPLTQDLRIDLNAVREAMTPETRIVSLTNPNNPTGQLIPYNDLVQFIDSIPESVIVCVDEAYIHFVEDEAYPSVVPLTKTRRNLLVARTMSKAFGLGGMRVGYGIAHTNLIDRMQPHLLGWLGRSTLGDVAAIAALEDKEHLHRVRQHVIREKAYLYQELTKMGIKPIKTETIFVIADMGKDTQPLVEELEARKVLIRQAFDMPNFIRISVGTRKENEVFLETLEEVLKSKVL